MSFGLRVSGGAAAVLLAGACSGRESEGRIPSPRHVVLVSLDTTRADHLDPYGSTRGATPRIARLAEAGVVFEQVLSPAPTTLAAHTSIMTGSYPQSHGVPRNGYVVDGRNEMLAELLAARGFHTAAFVGSYVLDSMFAFDQGFACFDERFDPPGERGGTGAAAAPGDPEAQSVSNQRPAEQVTDAVLAHLDRVDAERWFLFVHYFDAHQDYEPPASLAARFNPGGRLLRSSEVEVHAAIAAHSAAIFGRSIPVEQMVNAGLDRRLVEEADGRPLGADLELANLYTAEVGYVDREVGRLLDGLARRGLLAEALVVLTGDHGETFWEHGDTWNHGLWVYETTLSVPLILCLPRGQGAGLRVATPVSTVDILPTVCELLGLDPPARAEGVSLVPALAGHPFERGPIFSQATQLSLVEPPAPAWRNALKPRCVRLGRWKYVQAPYLSSTRELSELLLQPGLEQLFDLALDPGERTNLLHGELAPDAAAAYAELRSELSAWALSADPLDTLFNPERSDEVLQRLQQLGYAGSDGGSGGGAGGGSDGRSDPR